MNNKRLLIVCLLLSVIVLNLNGCKKVNSEQIANSSSSLIESGSYIDSAVDNTGSEELGSSSAVSQELYSSLTSSIATSKSISKSASTSAIITKAVSTVAEVNINDVSKTPAIMNSYFAYYDGNKVTVSTSNFNYIRKDGGILSGSKVEGRGSNTGTLRLSSGGVDLYCAVGPYFYSTDNLVLYINYCSKSTSSYSPPSLHKIGLDGSNDVRLKGWFLYNAFKSGDYIYADALVDRTNEPSGLIVPTVLGSNDPRTAIRVNINDFTVKDYGNDIKFFNQDSFIENNDYALYTKISNDKELYLLDNKTDTAIKITDTGFNMAALMNGYLLYEDKNTEIKAVLLSEAGKKTPTVISKSIANKDNVRFMNLSECNEFTPDFRSGTMPDGFFNGGYTIKDGSGSGYGDPVLHVILFSGKSFDIKSGKGLMPLFVVGNNLYFYKVTEYAGNYSYNAVVYDINTGLPAANSNINFIQ